MVSAKNIVGTVVGVLGLVIGSICAGIGLANRANTKKETKKREEVEQQEAAREREETKKREETELEERMREKIRQEDAGEKREWEQENARVRRIPAGATYSDVLRCEPVGGIVLAPENQMGLRFRSMFIALAKDVADFVESDCMGDYDQVAGDKLSEKATNCLRCAFDYVKLTGKTVQTSGLPDGMREYLNAHSTMFIKTKVLNIQNMTWHCAIGSNSVGKYIEISEFRKKVNFDGRTWEQRTSDADRDRDRHEARAPKPAAADGSQDLRNFVDDTNSLAAAGLLLTAEGMAKFGTPCAAKDWSMIGDDEDEKEKEKEKEKKDGKKEKKDGKKVSFNEEKPVPS